jgi:hypothetical protein
MRWCISVLHTHPISRPHCMQTLISGWNVLLLNDLICILTGYGICYLLAYFSQTFMPQRILAIYFDRGSWYAHFCWYYLWNTLQWKYHTTGTNLVILHINNSYGNRSLTPRMVRHRCLKKMIKNSESNHSFCQYVFIEQLLCLRHHIVRCVFIRQVWSFSSWSCHSTGREATELNKQVNIYM